ncbi:MAG: hypothetical protein HYT93_04745 [Parcubacteria group bacterium]|nr:hypothetical protein [Parcubacteria group bacterium]
MFRFLKDKSSFKCFTPEVMVATVLVEGALALYTLLRYHSTLFGRIATAILILLAFFQAAEYHICTGENIFMWAQIGFVAITFLPILGYHLVCLVTGEKPLLKLGYALAFLFSIYFIFGPNTLTSPVCTGNYIIFNTAQVLAYLYTTYYFGFLFLGIGESIEWIQKLRTIHGKGGALFFMVVGYLSFIVPMVFVLTTLKLTANTIPSIMCGFAIIFALILGLKVVPEYHSENSSKGL